MASQPQKKTKTHHTHTHTHTHFFPFFEPASLPPPPPPFFFLKPPSPPSTHPPTHPPTHLLQVLTVKLGIASKRDLAQMCAEAYSPRFSTFLWITAEVNHSSTHPPTHPPTHSQMGEKLCMCVYLSSTLHTHPSTHLPTPTDRHRRLRPGGSDWLCHCPPAPLWPAPHMGLLPNRPRYVLPPTHPPIHPPRPTPHSNPRLVLLYQSSY